MDGRPNPPGSGHIPTLDGLRAFSIIVVILSHSGWNRGIPGLFGVTIFFFLSGYLITTLLRQERAKTGTISFGKFYLRRVLRIFPPLYLAIAVASILCILGVVPAVLTWKAFFAQTLFLANYYEISMGDVGMAPGMSILWSLAVEEHFYMVFPLLYFVLLLANWTSGRQAAVLVSLCAAVLAWRLVLVHVFHVGVADASQGWARLAHASDTRIDSILWGCALAVYGNPFLDETTIREKVWKRVLFPLAVAVLLASFVYRSDYFRSTFRYSIQGMALIPIFVVGVRYPDWWLMRPLNWSWVRRLGVLSYSMYLLHQVAIDVVARHVSASTAVRAVLSFLITYLASDLVWRTVEKPSAAWRKRLSI